MPETRHVSLDALGFTSYREQDNQHPEVRIAFQKADPRVTIAVLSFKNTWAEVNRTLVRDVTQRMSRLTAEFMSNQGCGMHPSRNFDADPLEWGDIVGYQEWDDDPYHGLIHLAAHTSLERLLCSRYFVSGEPYHVGECVVKVRDLVYKVVCNRNLGPLMFPWAEGLLIATAVLHELYRGWPYGRHIDDEHISAIFTGHTRPSVTDFPYNLIVLGEEVQSPPR